MADRRQPVHTVYGGAQLFRADTARRLGELARAALDAWAPDAGVLATVFDLPDGIAGTVHERVADKLRREPVEDFRIDFEDGYGHRPDDEEDGHARSAAVELARGLADGLLPPFIGIRIKPLTDELRRRSLRTLNLVLETLVAEAGGTLPPNFLITLPKITEPAQAALLADELERLEQRLGLEPGRLVFELMVETPQIIIGADGRCALPAVVAAGRGRAIAAHFGTYDYTAAVGVTAGYQRMRHPACDFARHVMQVTLAGTDVFLSDGSTTVLPVPPHRGGAGQELDEGRLRENQQVVHCAWRLHYDDVRDSLARGFYQGWDLHPAQLVSRYAALYAFFLEAVDDAGARLHNFLERAAQATLVGAVFDDAATGQGLLNFFLRATNSGALSEEETVERTGLTPQELRSRSFVRILEGRRE
jgi:citrate lyase beta subunit